MWLVNGPDDPQPNPVSCGPLTSKNYSSKNKRRRTGDENSGPLTKKTDSVKLLMAVRPPTSKDCSSSSSSSSSSSCSASSSASDTKAAAASESTTLPPLLDIDHTEPVRLALVGATGLVGRACAQHIAQNPDLGYKINFFVGMSASDQTETNK